MERDFKPINYKLSTSRLLLVVFDCFDGPIACAKSVGLEYQKLVNWRAAGYVPLKHIGKMARKLKIPPEVLNYEQSIDFIGKGEDFQKLVTNFMKQNGYTSKQALWVLKGKQPKKVKEILA